VKTFVSMIVSVALHGLALALLVAGARFSWPSSPLPIELKTEVRRAAPRPQPPPAASTSPAPPGPGPKRAAKPAPALPPPPEPKDLKGFAPDDATVVVLLRVDKLAKSPNREALEYLCNLLPDYRNLIGQSGTKLEDFVAVLIATANPRDVAATFIAASYKDSPKIRAIAGHALGPSDPRVFRFVRPGLAVLVRPDEAALMDGAPSPLDAGLDPRRRWLTQLDQLDQIGTQKDGPAVLITISDVPSLVRLGDGLPTPLAAAVALTLDASPAVRLKTTFASEADAMRMEREWPQILKRYRTATALVGLTAALDGLVLSRNGADLDLSGRLPATEVRLALQLAHAFVPPPPTEAKPEATPATTPTSPPAPTQEPSSTPDQGL